MMTDRSKRNITPGKGEINTFMDCNHFLGKMFVQQACGVLFVAGAQTDDEMSCENARSGGYCPRGYAR